MSDTPRQIHVATILGCPPPRRISPTQLEKIHEATFCANTHRVEIQAATLLDIIQDLSDTRSAFGEPSTREERIEWHLERLSHEFREHLNENRT